MRRSFIETLIGAFVLLVVGGFFAYGWGIVQTQGGEDNGHYQLSARFNAIDGLTRGSDVRLGGVKIGSISHQYIDPQDYQAVVDMIINGAVRIPADSIAVIANDGLLGGKYVRVENGQAADFLKAEDYFTNTRDVVVLEDLLGRAIFMLSHQE